MSNIKQVLMSRDAMTSEEADSLIAEAKVALQEYLDNGQLDYAEDVCQEFFGLEPDYVIELLDF